jgi:long-chain acyl-CoA synthetase
VEFLIERFRENLEKTAILWQEEEYTYGWLLKRSESAGVMLKANGIEAGDIVALRSDFNPSSIAFLIALLRNDNIIVPLSHAVKTLDEFCEIAEVEHLIEIDGDQQRFERRGSQARHEILLALKERNHPGLVLFSSGSTGKSKAAVHDFVPLLSKFKAKRHALRTITFLLFDHIGGINTLFYILSNVGIVVAPQERDPENICRLIEKYQVELLPTSPTFINMILMGRAYEKYDLSSLKLVTYGTEAMPEQTLKRFADLFPHIELKQTYGLSEIGIMRSRSRNSDSLWLKIGGEDYQTKTVDGILYIKAKTAMLGYLNHPSPFDEEGWFNTQDEVQVDGEWVKILGRETDIINVGGQKVYPAEVESVLLGIDNIAEVSVFGRPNPIMGYVVAARVNLKVEEPLSTLKKRIRTYCKEKLEPFKIPAHVEIAAEKQISDRFKKVR